MAAVGDKYKKTFKDDDVIIKRYEQTDITPIYWDRLNLLLDMKAKANITDDDDEFIDDDELELIDDEIASIQRLSVIESNIKEISWQIEFRKMRGISFEEYEAMLKQQNHYFQTEVDYITNMKYNKLLDIVDNTADVVDIVDIKGSVSVEDYKPKPEDISTSLPGLLGGKRKSKRKSKRRKSKSKSKISYKKRRSVSKKKKKYNK